MSVKLYNFDPATQLTRFRPKLAKVMAGLPGARCRVLCLGDSQVAGVGGGLPGATTSNYRAIGSFPWQLVRYLKLLGVPAQGDSFFGLANDGTSGTTPTADSRLNLVGGCGTSGFALLGGPAITPGAAGAGVDFVPGGSGVYDRCDVFYQDGGGAPTVGFDGGTASALTVGNTGVVKVQTLSPTAGTHTLNIRTTSSSQFFFQGAGFWSSTVPAVEVYNGGSGGADSTVYQNPSSGGPLNGAIATLPDLCIYNDFTNDVNNGSPSAAAYRTNIGNTVAALQAAGIDVILHLPAPFTSGNYAGSLPAFRAQLRSVADQYNVPLVDFSAMFADTLANTYGTGLMDSNLHPNSGLYGILAREYARLLVEA